MTLQSLPARFRCGPALVEVFSFGFLLLWPFGAHLHASDHQDPAVVTSVQDLDFDAPESWAMKYFTSASLQTAVGQVAARGVGTVDLGIEFLWMPHLDESQRTVGFDGRKEENLNRSPVWVRLRGSVGLGAGWSATVGWVPPVEIDGAEADLWSLGLERNLWRSTTWALGLRLHGQAGTVTGDFTCGAGTEAFAPGSADNRFGCRAPSRDEITMDYAAIEFLASVDLGAARSGAWPTLHAGVSGTRMDTEFQVDALIFGIRDRTLLRTEGETFVWTLGASWPLGRRARLGTEIFYSPLDVRRRGEPVTSDDLLHLRLVWHWRVR